MAGLVHHVAIVSETPSVTFDDISVVAAAVAKQVVRDFGPAWGISATVQAFGALDSVPPDYWPVLIVEAGSIPNAAGYHTDGNGQPLAVVEAEGDWPCVVSHEVLEMLADPYGSRIMSADAPTQMAKDIGIPSMERVDYLVEVCDPVDAFSYRINGLRVANFVFPSFYATTATYGDKCDHLGSLHGYGPRSVLPGGYISFRDPETMEWYQITVDSNGVVLGCNVPNVGGDCSRSRMDRNANRVRTENIVRLRRKHPTYSAYAAGTRDFIRTRI